MFRMKPPIRQQLQPARWPWMILRVSWRWRSLYAGVDSDKAQKETKHTIQLPSHADTIRYKCIIILANPSPPSTLRLRHD